MARKKANTDMGMGRYGGLTKGGSSAGKSPKAMPSHAEGAELASHVGARPRTRGTGGRRKK